MAAQLINVAVIKRGTQVFHTDDGFYYYRHMDKHNRTQLRCVRYGQATPCPARITIPLDPIHRTVANINYGKRPHNHEPMREWFEAQCARYRCVQRCTQEATQYRQVFNEETSGLPANAAAELPYQPVSQAMYRARKKIHLEIPETFLECSLVLEGNAITEEPERQQELYRFEDMQSSRGALIVVEGCDRSGKTTQCKKVVNVLKNKNIAAEYLNFPDRNTPVGKLINDFLTKKEDFSDKTIHLLFSANRWELAPKIEQLLNEGTTVVVDRYAYSGVAFSAIKPEMDFEWCKVPDAGLPKPDLVLLLNLSPEAMKARGGFGKERYEQDEIQAKVAKVFKTMQDSSWKEINADKSEDVLNEELVSHVEEVLKSCRTLPLGHLW